MKVCLGVKQHAQPIAHDRVVVGDHDRDRRVRRRIGCDDPTLLPGAQSAATFVILRFVHSPQPDPPAVPSLDAEAILRAARRPLVLGIGGGGDVVGAFATAESLRRYDGADPIVGGLTWERGPIDPEPGPRRAEEIADARLLAPGVLLAGPRTRVRDRDVLFAESRMAEYLGSSTVLVDITAGPATIAAGVAEAADALGCDHLVFIDVGGDVLAAGDEPGLRSPLCDAVMLAAASHSRAPGARSCSGSLASAAMPS